MNEMIDHHEKLRSISSSINIGMFTNERTIDSQLGVYIQLNFPSTDK